MDRGETGRYIRVKFAGDIGVTIPGVGCFNIGEIKMLSPHDWNKIKGNKNFTEIKEAGPEPIKKGKRRKMPVKKSKKQSR
ncbi:hypothetical protein KKH23_11175 [Patescibacteria group bacterium]|nr:hypothetical protein [Patescibacteria group bacterium]